MSAVVNEQYYNQFIVYPGELSRGHHLPTPSNSLGNLSYMQKILRECIPALRTIQALVRGGSARCGNRQRARRVKVIRAQLAQNELERVELMEAMETNEFVRGNLENELKELEELEEQQDLSDDVVDTERRCNVVDWGTKKPVIGNNIEEIVGNEGGINAKKCYDIEEEVMGMKPDYKLPSACWSGAGSGARKKVMIAWGYKWEQIPSEKRVKKGPLFWWTRD